MNPQLLAHGTHEPLIAHHHHLLGGARPIQPDLKSLVERTDREQELDASQMHADAVSGSRAERPVHGFHFGGRTVCPSVRVEVVRAVKDCGVALRAVGQIAHYDAGGDKVPPDHLAGRDAWCGGGDGSSEAESLLDDAVEVGLSVGSLGQHRFVLQQEYLGMGNRNELV